MSLLSTAVCKKPRWSTVPPIFYIIHPNFPNIKVAFKTHFTETKRKTGTTEVVPVGFSR